MRSLLRRTVCSLVVLGVLVPASPRLEAPPPEPPCAADAKKLCPDTPAGGGRLQACLRAHESELSTECRNQLVGVRREAGVFMSICRADVTRFCKDVPPGGGRLIACLQAKETSLSPECREALHKRAVR